MIEQIYRVTVHYDGDSERVSDAFHREFYEHGPSILDVESFAGCPAAGPYLNVECNDLQKARLVEASMIKIIRKNGGEIAAE